MSIDRTDLEASFSEVVSANVIEYATEASAALSSFPTIPLTSATYRQPVLTALPTSGFLAADQDAKPQSGAAWDGVTHTPEELAVIVPISMSAIADANFDVVGTVERLIGQEFARAIDAAAFFGTGAPTSWPATGIVGAAITATQTLTETADLGDDINNVFGLVEAATDVTHVFGGRQLKTGLRGLTGPAGGPAYVPTLGAANVDSLYGVPLRYPLGWDWSTAHVLAMDAKGVQVGIRQNIEISTSEHATLTTFGSLWEKDSVAIRAHMRISLVHVNPISIHTGAQFLPFAVIEDDGV